MNKHRYVVKRGQDIKNMTAFWEIPCLHHKTQTNLYEVTKTGTYLAIVHIF